MYFKFLITFFVKKMKILMKKILNFESNTQTPLERAFTALLTASNIFGGANVHQTKNKRF